MNQPRVQFVPVPPPKVAPIHPESVALGIPGYFSVDKSGHAGARCCVCRGAFAAEDALVWVPDSLTWDMQFHPKKAKERAEEAARQGAYNGGGSGVCVQCVKSVFSPKIVTRTINAVPSGFRSFFNLIFQ